MQAQGSLERDDEVILKCELCLNIAFLLILVGCNIKCDKCSLLFKKNVCYSFLNIKKTQSTLSRKEIINWYFVSWKLDILGS